jgi:hypothetical protein
MVFMRRAMRMDKESVLDRNNPNIHTAASAIFSRMLNKTHTKIIRDESIVVPIDGKR